LFTPTTSLIARLRYKRLDEQLPDGETGSFEITKEELLFFSIYDEHKPCGQVENRVNQGRLYKHQ